MKMMEHSKWYLCHRMSSRVHASPSVSSSSPESIAPPPVTHHDHRLPLDRTEGRPPPLDPRHAHRAWKRPKGIPALGAPTNRADWMRLDFRGAVVPVPPGGAVSGDYSDLHRIAA